MKTKVAEKDHYALEPLDLVNRKVVMKIVMFAGSLRKDSLNKKFVHVAEAILKKNSDLSVQVIDLKDFQIPVYDGDIEDVGIPENVKKVGEIVGSAEALIISTPEYNGSIPGPLKNWIDWLSRLKPVPLTAKPLLLIGASPGALGAVRSLWHTRQPFDVLNVHVFPEMLGLPKAHEAFDGTGKLKDGKMQERLEKLLDSFIKHSGKLSPQ